MHECVQTTKKANTSVSQIFLGQLREFITNKSRSLDKIRSNHKTQDTLTRSVFGLIWIRIRTHPQIRFRTLRFPVRSQDKKFFLISFIMIIVKLCMTAISGHPGQDSHVGDIYERTARTVQPKQL
jgi:hypothetical protein